MIIILFTDWILSGVKDWNYLVYDGFKVFILQYSKNFYIQANFCLKKKINQEALKSYLMFSPNVFIVYGFRIIPELFLAVLIKYLFCFNIILSYQMICFFLIGYWLGIFISGYMTSTAVKISKSLGFLNTFVECDVYSCVYHSFSGGERWISGDVVIALF